MTAAIDKHVPMRTCLGCRQGKPKSALLRLVRRDRGAVTVDPTGHAPGRGAYVCADRQCAERALQRERLSHAFRNKTEAGATLAEEVRRQWQRRR